MTVDLSLCPVLQEMYRTGRSSGKNGVEVVCSGGLSTLNNLATIRHFMFQARPQRTLEVGLAFGGSALMFAACHRVLGSPPSGQHIAIDAYQQAWDDPGLANLERAGLAGYVDFRREVSALALALAVKKKETYGIIYIDGSHEYEDVFVDFYYARRLIEVGGYVMFDDSADEQIQRVIRHAEADGKKSFRRIAMSRYRQGSIWHRVRWTAAEALRRNQLTVFQRKS